jgi:UDP-glucose 4-epimerase
MKILVTGALGHIGSLLIRKLSETFPDSTILLMDNMLTQRYASLFDLPKTAKYKLIEGDIVETEMSPIIKDCDVVIHLAALTEASKSANDPDLYARVNLAMTSKIADTCAKLGVPLIFPSSCSVYSSTKDKVDENCTHEDLNAQSPYAAVKLKEEEAILSKGISDQLKFTIFRLGTIAGVSAGMRFHTAVNSFCWSAIHGKPLNVWETALNQKRPYLSLEDLVDGVIHVIKNKIYKNQIYNILNANLTVKDIVGYIREEIPQVEINFVKSQIMNSLSYDVSSSKFSSTGFVYKSSIKKDVKETVKLMSAFL